MSELTVNGRAASPGFVRGNATFVASNATVFADEQEARSAYETVTSDEFLSCFHDFIEEEQTEGVTVLDVSVGQLLFPTYGDESMAIQAAIDLSSEGIEVSAFFDLVWVRSGRVIAGIGFADVLTPFSDTEKQELVAKVALNMGAEIPSSPGGAGTGVNAETGSSAGSTRARRSRATI